MPDPLSAFYDIQKLTRSTDKQLKEIFAGRIRGSFLTEMSYRIFEGGVFRLEQDFKLFPTPQEILMGLTDAVHYEVGCHIVGIHRANTAFLPPEEIRALQRDEQYKTALAEQIITDIRLRRYAAVIFRRIPLMLGDQFLYFPVPYKLFAMCMRALELLNRHGAVGSNPTALQLSVSILSGAVAALSLLGDNLPAAAYPSCRTVIELYSKLLLLKRHPEIGEAVEAFSGYDLMKNCCGESYSAEFNRVFDRRINHACKKSDYLHYGFVDRIAGYHTAVRQHPYSAAGLLEYLKQDAPDTAETLAFFYRQCNGYAHGSVSMSRYPLLHYFEISLILASTIPDVYQWLCGLFGEATEINGIALPERLQSDVDLLWSQYNDRSTERFEQFYSNK